MTDTNKQDQALTGIDGSKRRTLTRLALGAAFVTPVVASFSMDGLTISKVHAASAKGSGVKSESGNMTDCGNMIYCEVGNQTI
jgi:hypothetical protein